MVRLARWASAWLLLLVQAGVRAQGPQRNSFLPQLLATAGVTSTGNQTVDAAMQLAAVQHLQGWFATSTARYADAAQLAPTNADAFLGAALSFHSELPGCAAAARSLRAFLRLLREQGPLPRRDVRCKRAPTHQMRHADPPGKLRVFIDNGLFVDASTFRGMAAHVVDEYFCHFEPARVREGEIVFVNAFLLCAFVRVLHPLIREPYVLVTHNSDYPAPIQAPGYDFSHILRDRKLLAWFAHNANAVHPKLFALPQGFPVNTKTLAADWSAHLAFAAQKTMRERPRPPPLERRAQWLYVNFAPRNESARRDILRWARSRAAAPFVTLSGAARATGGGQRAHAKVAQEAFLAEMRAHRFVWCPPGNGLDTHRVYEALQQGTVPIVMAHAGLAAMYAQLPVVVVGRAEEITQERLAALVPVLQPAVDRLWTHEGDSVLSAHYWQAYVNSTVSRLRRERAARAAGGRG